MKEYYIYHSKDPMDMCLRLSKAPEQIDLDNYDLVAMVESESLGDTFRITNHIESNWLDNPEVRIAYKRERVRSTSVGDVVVEITDITLGEDGLGKVKTGKAYMVMGVGWEEVKV